MYIFIVLSDLSFFNLIKFNYMCVCVYNYTFITMFNYINRHFYVSLKSLYVFFRDIENQRNRLLTKKQTYKKLLKSNDFKLEK